MMRFHDPESALGLFGGREKKEEGEGGGQEAWWPQVSGKTRSKIDPSEGHAFGWPLYRTVFATCYFSVFFSLFSTWIMKEEISQYFDIGIVNSYHHHHITTAT